MATAVTATRIISVDPERRGEDGQRYMMEEVAVGHIRKGSYSKTALLNLAEVGKGVGRDPRLLLSYLGHVAGAKTEIQTIRTKAKLSKSTKPQVTHNYHMAGIFPKPTLAATIDDFITQFVLCSKCRNPETAITRAQSTQDPDVPSKKAPIQDAVHVALSCNACGAVEPVNAPGKMLKLLLKYKGLEGADGGAAQGSIVQEEEQQYEEVTRQAREGDDVFLSEGASEGSPVEALREWFRGGDGSGLGLMEKVFDLKLDYGLSEKDTISLAVSLVPELQRGKDPTPLVPVLARCVAPRRQGHLLKALARVDLPAVRIVRFIDVFIDSDILSLESVAAWHASLNPTKHTQLKRALQPYFDLHNDLSSDSSSES